MTETREVKTWRTIYYVSRQLIDDDQGVIDMMTNTARDGLPEGFNVIGEPHVAISKPLPPFEFGVDEDGNTYRRPDAVMIDFKGWQS